MASDRARSGRFGSYILVALPVLLTIALGLHRLESKSLWRDEFDTLTFAGWGTSWADAWRLPLTIPVIPAPPLYYVVAHAFTSLGSGEFALRLPSAMWSVLIIPLTYVLGKSVFDERVGLLGAFLLSIAPLHIRYAQEARGYAMLTFFSVLSLYLFWRAITTGEGRWWVGFVASSIVGLYTHFFSLLSIGAVAVFGLWLLVRRRKRDGFRFQARHFWVSALVVLLSLGPIVPFLMEGLTGSRGLGADEAGYGGLEWTVRFFSSLVRQFSGGSNPGLLFYGILLAVAVPVLVARQPEALALASMWIVLPVIMIMLVPFGHRLLIRYFIFALPVYLLVVASGLRVAITRLAGWFTRVLEGYAKPSVAARLAGAVAVGAVISVNLPSVVSLYSETKQNWSEVTQLLQDLAEPADAILVQSLSGNPADDIQYCTGIAYYAQQWYQQSDVECPVDVRGLRLSPGEPLALSDDFRGWLVGTLSRRFLPNKGMPARAERHRFLGPIIVESRHVPADVTFLAPFCFRPLAITRVEPFVGTDDTCQPGDWERLQAWVNSARQLGLESVNADLSLGLYAYCCGELDEAAGRLGRSLDDCGELVRPILLETLATVARERGLWDEALYYVQRALEWEEDYALALELQMGDIYRELGDWERAIELYERLTASNERVAGPHYGLGQVYEQMGEIELALAEYRQANELDSEGTWTHVRNRRIAELTAELADRYLSDGDALMEEGHVEGAVTAYLGALDVHPGSAGAHVRLADARMAQGRYRDAVDGYLAALDLKSDWDEQSWMHMRLANAYRDDGQTEEAIREYGKVLELQSEHSGAARGLEELVGESPQSATNCPPGG